MQSKFDVLFDHLCLFLQIKIIQNLQPLECSSCKSSVRKCNSVEILHICPYYCMYTMRKIHPKW